MNVVSRSINRLRVLVRVEDGAPALPTGGILLGVGGAPGAVEQAQGFVRARPESLVMAINHRIAPDLGRRHKPWPGQLDVAASMHITTLPTWIERRVNKPDDDHPGCGLDRPRAVLGFSKELRPMELVDFVLSCEFPVGSSGFLPVLFGLFFLHCRAVVLAGVELTHPGYRRYIRAWRKAHDEGLLENVWSVTPGPVQDLVGPPPTEIFREAA